MAVLRTINGNNIKDIRARKLATCANYPTTECLADTAVNSDVLAGGADSAARHNSYYRGKNITSVINTSTVRDHIDNGIFSDVYVGDYFTISNCLRYRVTGSNSVSYDGGSRTITFRVVHLDYYYGASASTLGTKHHIIIMPDEALGIGLQYNASYSVVYSNSYIHTMLMTYMNNIVKNFLGSSGTTLQMTSHTMYCTTALASGGYPQTISSVSVTGGCLPTTCQLMGDPGFGNPMDMGLDRMQFAAMRLNPSLMALKDWTTDGATWTSDTGTLTPVFKAQWCRNPGPTTGTFCIRNGYGSNQAAAATSTDIRVRPFWVLAA